MEFVRINKTLEDKGIVLSRLEAEQFYLETIQKQNKLDWYQSLFVFGPEAKEHFDTKGGSLAGYNGPAYTNNIVFDLDNNDLEKAREDVCKLLSRLAKDIGLGREGINKHVRVYFSGNKGFHVFIKTSRQFSPEELKEYCRAIAGDLTSFDAKIYNTTRCFRVANTLNPKSGLYKIPISLDLTKDKDGVAKIKELAKVAQFVKDLTEPLQDLTLIDNYVKIKQDIKRKSVVVDEDVKEINGIRGLNTVDFKKGKGVPKCIYALSQGVMVPGKGQRHEVFLHLGNYYRNQGHNPVVVEGILKGIAKLNFKLYPEHAEFSDYEIKNSILKMVFSDEEKLNVGGWGVSPENEIFASYCKALPNGDKCPIHTKQNKRSIVTITDMAKDFTGFAANFEDSIVKTGIEFIDKHVNIAIGTTNIVVGASGTGKTSAVLSMLEKANEEKQGSVFFSLDMSKSLLYLKLAQRHTKLDQETIFTAFKTHDIKKISFIQDAINDKYKHTFFDFSGALTLQDMQQRIDLLEQENSKKMKIVVVDYASRMKGPYSDSNTNEAYNALLSKDIADETQAAWIILAQISRANGDGSTPLRSKRVIKATSAWEESASCILNIWRPFLGLHNVHDAVNDVTFYDKYMRVYISKNRIGEEKEGVLHWEGKGGIVRDLTAEEQELFDIEERPKEKLVAAYRYASK